MLGYGLWIQKKSTLDPDPNLSLVGLKQIVPRNGHFQLNQGAIIRKQSLGKIIVGRKVGYTKIFTHKGINIWDAYALQISFRNTNGR